MGMKHIWSDDARPLAVVCTRCGAPLVVHEEYSWSSKLHQYRVREDCPFKMYDTHWRVVVPEPIDGKALAEIIEAALEARLVDVRASKTEEVRLSP